MLEIELVDIKSIIPIPSAVARSAAAGGGRQLPSGSGPALMPMGSQAEASPEGEAIPVNTHWLSILNSGRYGIRTHGDPEATTAFEAAPFVRSGNLPGTTLPEAPGPLRKRSTVHRSGGSRWSDHHRAGRRAGLVARRVGVPGLGEAPHRLLQDGRFRRVGQPELAVVVAAG